MTLPRMAALNKVWRLTPPVAETLAAIATWLGAIHPPRREVQSNAAQLAEELGGLDGFLIERGKKRG